MKRCADILVSTALILLFTGVKAQDSLQFKGQLSVWGHLNSANTLPMLVGSRYLPTMNYTIRTGKENAIDFEVAANLTGSSAFRPFDSLQSNGSLKAYRAWVRYSGQQFELRAGLQKINFGSASMLRPLMWFDRIDPRDPLQLTDGVWGMLGRYYFLNNANLWLWGLYGNDRLKAWEITPTSDQIPEWGGRIQHPVPKGEVALTFHHRSTEVFLPVNTIEATSSSPESRIGLDGKWDLEIGLWFEGVWIHKQKNLGILTNQEILNLGMDYTFGIGNGLNVALEQLLLSSDETAFSFSNTTSFSATSLSYPMGISNHLSAIVYYDWTNDNLYNFINWKHQFPKITFYLMAYSNPKNYQMPQQNDSGNFFAGQGFQVMLVYNH